VFLKSKLSVTFLSDELGINKIYLKKWFSNYQICHQGQPILYIQGTSEQRLLILLNKKDNLLRQQH